MTVYGWEFLVGYALLSLRMAISIATLLSGLVPLIVLWQFGFEAAVVVGFGVVSFILVQLLERLELIRQTLERSEYD